MPLTGRVGAAQQPGRAAGTVDPGGLQAAAGSPVDVPRVTGDQQHRPGRHPAVLVGVGVRGSRSNSSRTPPPEQRVRHPGRGVGQGHQAQPRGPHRPGPGGHLRWTGRPAKRSTTCCTGRSGPYTAARGARRPGAVHKTTPLRNGTGAVDARLSPDGSTLSVTGGRGRVLSTSAGTGGDLAELPGSPSPYRLAPRPPASSSCGPHAWRAGPDRRPGVVRAPWRPEQDRPLPRSPPPAPAARTPGCTRQRPQHHRCRGL